MDYVEAFKNLRTNQKYSRKSPHKAVLLLTVINLIEKNKISDNEIKYDNVLKDEFLSLWNKLLPYEVRFFPDAYLPFWYMENERFWHIVPIRGREDIVIMMRDEHIKPSNSKLADCVNYAELDEDLYFLMTLSSGRQQLREALLETYFELTDAEIARQKCDTFVEKTNLHIEDVAAMGSSLHDSKRDISHKDSAFFNLPLDIQIELNYNYYDFLKKHIYEREEFLRLFPNVNSLYKRLANDYLAPESMTMSFAELYKEFLQDIKISLMSCDSAMNLIDSISCALSAFNEDVPEEEYVYTENTDFDLSLHETDCNMQNDNPISAILESNNGAGDNEAYAVASSSGYRIVNLENECAIYDITGDEVYSSSGNVKIFNGQYFRFNYKGPCFTVKELISSGETFNKGPKLLVAYNSTPLYKSINPVSYIDDIEDFHFSWIQEEIKIKVRGVWFDNAGNRIESEDNADIDDAVVSNNSEKRMEHYWDEVFLDYSPKGKLKGIAAINDFANSSYDFLWLMAITDLMNSYNAPDILTFDEIACMMIANAWELFRLLPDAKDKETVLSDCIDFLIEESKEYMDDELSFLSTKESVYEAIKDYPMAGVFEDAVESLVNDSPLDVLRLWYGDIDVAERIGRSSIFEDNCLYSVTMRRRDPYITVNPKSKRSLMYEHDNIIHYLHIQYHKFIGK